MRTLLLAGTSLLALSASVVTASALPTTTFAYTGGFQTFTAPTASPYDILAIGAGGGNSVPPPWAAWAPRSKAPSASRPARC